MQVQYRNCNYIGGFHIQQYQRNGYGLLIFDNASIIMAKWKSDAINGPFAIITDRMKVLGTMNNNKLQGYNVISVQQSLISNKKENPRTIYGMMRDNKLYGKAIIIDDNQTILAHFKNGELIQISDKKLTKEKQVYEMLQLCFPNQIYAIQDWLSHIFSQTCREFHNEDCKYKPTYHRYQDLHFYGFVDVFNNSRGIGFLLNEGEVMSIGQHNKDALNGLGRAYYRNGTVEDGVFKQGELDGVGIRYNKANNKYIFGQHNKQKDDFKNGVGFPEKQITQIRKQFHLRSINFYNDIVTLHFQTILQNICSKCLTFHQVNESPRFSNNLKEKAGLSEVEWQRPNTMQQHNQWSEEVQRPSMKNKSMNQQREQTHSTPDHKSKRKIDWVEQKNPLHRKKIIIQNTIPKRIKCRNTKQLIRELQQQQRISRGYPRENIKEHKLYQM